MSSVSDGYFEQHIEQPDIDVGATFEQLVERSRSCSSIARVQRLREVEMAIRRLEAETALLVRDIDRDGSYTADGHVSVSGFLRGEFRWSQAQVTSRKRLAALVDAVPSVLEHLHDGVIGVAQANGFGRAGANPRCGGQLVDHAETLLRFARALPHEHFHLAIQRWERLADADGALHDAEASHEHRAAHLTFFDGVGRLAARCGALDHAEFSAIFERYEHAEFLADWAWAVATYGEDAAGSMLARTASQRSWDALMRMANDAVSTPAGAQPPEPVVHLTCGITHVEEQMAASGLIPAPGSSPEPTLSELPVEHWRCETSNGVPLTPFEVMLAAIHGRVRRVVFGSDGVVLDYGRLRRLFDGPARDAAMLVSPTCVFPGCCRPSMWCQADHIVPWAAGGGTDVANCGPLCARHNRMRNRGFAVWRDPAGVFHTYRPDGTEIAPPPSPPGTSPPTQSAAA